MFWIIWKNKFTLIYECAQILNIYTSLKKFSIFNIGDGNNKNKRCKLKFSILILVMQIIVPAKSLCFFLLCFP